MDIEDFNKLDSTVRMSLVIAMHIRNEMENFHAEHLSDEQMKELNPIIRQATYDILNYLKVASNDENKGGKIVAKGVINFLIQSIPDYWEFPNESNPSIRFQNPS